ncbi:SDR family oxidoreductase [Rubritepida flocculans]|uniref:SDR family oxidoreductase n=1 Tax=Rubritepida flocculans TaxID=182403 RepID=UPI000426A533|nr:SDR family oxidoreductase [Rubritepida flocculans]
MFAPDLLAGARVLVTGGGSGLGRMMAEFLLAHGAAVELWGRRAPVLEEAAAALGAAHPGRLRWQAVDIKDPDAVEAAVAASFAAGHGPTHLINNAAGNFLSRTEDLSPRGFRAISDIVLHGTFQVTQSLGKRWIAAGTGGSVVSILVTWIWTGAPFVVPSAMSKAGVEAMTKSLAVEWGRYGIRLNGIAPGLIPTEGMLARIRPGEADPAGKWNARNPLGRTGRPEDIGRLAAFLLSDAAGWITGQTIALDGGHWLANGAGSYTEYLAWGDAEWEAARERIKAANAADKARRGA